MTAGPFEELFASVRPCARCMQQTTAFGVKVCRLGKPAPVTQSSCAFFRKKPS